ncbi:hypothetical protein NUACC21_41260 [Scytonema sp. NUACC21]
MQRKAEIAGGQFITFSTSYTALLQTHLNGQRIKKSLSERVHKDVTGKAVMHRDLFSAYLSRLVNEDQLLWESAARQYSGTEPSLVDAWKRYENQTASRVGKSVREACAPAHKREDSFSLKAVIPERQKV